MSEAPNAQELDAGTLRRSCRAEDLGFASTQEVPPLEGTVGQARAHAAIAFGLDAETVGYNIFVTGQAGTGKRTSVEAHLHDHGRRRPAASDLVYVHNFRDPRRPIEIELPSGTARALAADMRTFLEDARRDLAAAFGTLHARVEERLDRWAKLDEADEDSATPGAREGVPTDRPRA